MSTFPNPQALGNYVESTVLTCFYLKIAFLFLPLSKQCKLIIFIHKYFFTPKCSFWGEKNSRYKNLFVLVHTSASVLDLSVTPPLACRYFSLVSAKASWAIRKLTRYCSSCVLMNFSRLLIFSKVREISSWSLSKWILLSVSDVSIPSWCWCICSKCTRQSWKEYIYLRNNYCSDNCWHRYIMFSLANANLFLSLTIPVMPCFIQFCKLHVQSSEFSCNALFPYFLFNWKIETLKWLSNFLLSKSAKDTNLMIRPDGDFKVWHHTLHFQSPICSICCWLQNFFWFVSINGLKMNKVNNNKNEINKLRLLIKAENKKWKCKYKFMGGWVSEYTPILIISRFQQFFKGKDEK